MKKLKLLIGMIGLSLVFNATGNNNNDDDDKTNLNDIQSVVIDDNAFSDDVQTNTLKNKFSSYNLIQNSNEIKIEASNSSTLEKSQEVNNMAFSLGESIVTNYDLSYNIETDSIIVNLSYFSENNLILNECFSGYPIYYEDGSYDAIFNIDGNKVYLSDLEKNTIQNCFALTILGLSSLFAAITSALITAAKVAVVICAVVAIGYATYKVASLTKAKIEERERSVAKEERYSNPYVYYPATRKDGQLLIASAPVGLCYAANNIIKNVDFWTPFGYLAKKLAIRASGTYIGPERDSNRNGYYQHYHLAKRKGGHAFFGYPYNNVYVM